MYIFVVISFKFHDNWLVQEPLQSHSWKFEKAVWWVTESLSASVSAMEVQMEPAVECTDRTMHCCALSSDNDSLCEEPTVGAATGGRPWTRLLSSSSSSSSFCTDRLSSGYSSIQSAPSPSISSSQVSPQNPAGFCLLLPPAQRTRRQVKRKNTAAHSGGEPEHDEDAANVAFLSLWLIDRKLPSLNASLPGCLPGALWFTGADGLYLRAARVR